MDLLARAISHIGETAAVPSFSTYEERLHPYIRNVFGSLDRFDEVEVAGNNLVFKSRSFTSGKGVALAAHIDKINHYGQTFPEKLPVRLAGHFIEGAMDDSAGVGILLALAEGIEEGDGGYIFFFSEMEESKGLKEHPELLKNSGADYHHGMGARRISKSCMEQELIPSEVITVDTTPLFKGRPGVALYSNHWELNELEPSRALIKETEEMVKRFKEIEAGIHLDNNTNDYLHYGYEFNHQQETPVPSVALEPAIFPYHQKGERVFIKDIERVMKILQQYLLSRRSAS